MGAILWAALVLLLYCPPATPVGTLPELRAALKNGGAVVLTQQISIIGPEVLEAAEPLLLQCSDDFNSEVVLSISGADVTLRNLRFTGCKHGTVIQVVDGASLEMDTVHIFGNSAPAEQGILHVSDGSVSMSACVLSNNTCSNCSLVVLESTEAASSFAMLAGTQMVNNAVKHLTRVVDSRQMQIQLRSSALWNDVELRAAFTNNKFVQHYSQNPASAAFNTFTIDGNVQISDNNPTGDAFIFVRTTVQLTSSMFTLNTGNSSLLKLSESRLRMVDCSLSQNEFRNGSLVNISQHWGINAFEGVRFEGNVGDKVIDVMGSTLFRTLEAYQDGRFDEETARSSRETAVDKAQYDVFTTEIAKNVKVKDSNKQTTPVYLRNVNFTRCKVSSSLIHINGSDPQNIRRVATEWKENSTLLHIVDVKIEQCTVTAITQNSPGPKALLHMQHFNGSLTRLIVVGNTAPDVMNVNSDTFMLHDSVIKQNVAATPDTGTVWWQKWSYNILDNTTFEQNTGFAGVVYVLQATTKMVGCTFASNSLTNSNQSITTSIVMLEGGDGDVNQTRFDNNTANMILNGPGMSIIVAGCNFTHNNGTSLKLRSGGAIFKLFVATVEKCTFTNNQGGDGTLALESGKFNVGKCKFSGNQAVRGGAIFATTTDTQEQTEARVHITDCDIRNNSASQHGGGLWIGDAAAINKTTIVGNNATGSGGGIYVYNTFFMTGIATEVSNNRAVSGGGITALQPTNLQLINTTIADNVATQDSAEGSQNICDGLGPANSCITLHGVPCRPGGGGALCAVSLNQDKAAVQNTTIEGNKANYGGALYVDCAMQSNCQLTVDTNVTLQGNTLLAGSNGTGEVLVASTPEAVCCKTASKDGECVPYGDPAAGNVCPELQGGPQVLGRQARERKVASLPSKLNGEVIPRPGTSLDPTSLLRAGSQISMNLSLSGSFNELIESMSIPITVTARIEPPHPDMLLVGNTTMEFEYPYTAFRNLTISRTVTSNDTRDYQLVFNATSPELRDYIGNYSWNFTIRGCTLGEYANQYRCESCSEEGRNQFSINTDVRCEPCPTAGVCGGDNSTGLLLPIPGVFQTSIMIPQLTRCPLQEACGKGKPQLEQEREKDLQAILRQFAGNYSNWTVTGVIADGSWEKAKALDAEFQRRQCAQGYTGLLCGTCKDGYGRLFNKCNRCLNPALNAILLIVFLVLLLGVISITVFGHLRTVSKVVGKYNPRHEGIQQNDISAVKAELVELSVFTAVFKVFVTYGQCLSMIRGMTLRLPRFLRNMFAGVDFTSASVSWVSLDCSTNMIGGWKSATMRVSAPLLIPVICILGATIFWIIVWGFKRRAQHQDTQKYVRDRMVMTTVQIVYFLYPAITTAVFAIFNCYKLSGPQTPIEEEYHKKVFLGNNMTDLWIQDLRWMQDFDTKCWVGEHRSLAVGLGVPAIFLYVLGIPAGFALLLWRKRNRLEEPRTILTMGFLYDGYQNKYFWWELVVMGRKLLLLIFSLVINSSNPSASYVQLCLLTLVVVCSLLLQQRHQPYSKPFVNELETIALFAINVTYILLGIFVIPDTISRTASVFALVTTVCINALVVILFIWNLIVLAMNWMRLQLAGNPNSWLSRFVTHQWTKNTPGPSDPEDVNPPSLLPVATHLSAQPNNVNQVPMDSHWQAAAAHNGAVQTGDLHYVMVPGPVKHGRHDGHHGNGQGLYSGTASNGSAVSDVIQLDQASYVNQGNAVNGGVGGLSGLHDGHQTWDRSQAGRVVNGGPLCSAVDARLNGQYAAGYVNGTDQVRVDRPVVGSQQAARRDDTNSYAPSGSMTGWRDL